MYLVRSTSTVIPGGVQKASAAQSKSQNECIMASVQFCGIGCYFSELDQIITLISNFVVEFRETIDLNNSWIH